MVALAVYYLKVGEDMTKEEIQAIRDRIRQTDEMDIQSSVLMAIICDDVPTLCNELEQAQAEIERYKRSAIDSADLYNKEHRIVLKLEHENHELIMYKDYTLQPKINSLEEQNNRYRQALETIAYDQLVSYKDSTEIARKALEGSGQ